MSYQYNPEWEREQPAMAVASHSSSVVVDTYKGVLCTVAEAPPIPPEYKQVFSHEYPLGKTYVGRASEGTSTFNVPLPDQLFPNAFVVDRIVDAFEDKVKEQGERMLDLKIYIDTTPTWRTDFMIKSTCTTSSPFPWAFLIAGILAIILVLVITNLVTTVIDFDWGVPAAIPILAILLGVGALAGVGIVLATKKRRR